MSDPDLGPLFTRPTPPTGKLDADEIIRRSRRRRLPRVVITTVVPIIAVLGLLGGGVYGLSHVVSVGGAASSASGTSSDVKEAPVAGAAPTPGQDNGLQVAAECGSPLPRAAGSTDDLVATSGFARPDSASAPGVTTITNRGSKPVTGSVGTPWVVLTAHGRVVAFTAATDDAGHPLTLAPGQSTTLPVYLPTTWCGGHPIQGSYQVTTELDLTTDSGNHEIVSGPTTEVHFGK